MKTWKVTANWPVTMRSVGHYEAETAEQAQELAQKDFFFYGDQQIYETGGTTEWEVTETN